MEKGKYTVIEGPDGGGSTTQINEVVKPALKELGLTLPKRRIHGTERSAQADVVFTREPGGTKEGELIRYDLLHDPNVDNTPQQEFAKFNRQRMLLGRAVLEPALRANQLVVSERSWLSSYAYQGFGWELDTELIAEVSRETMGPRLFIPDAMVVLMVPPEVTYERLRKRLNSNPDKIERRNLAYFQRVYEGYEEGVKRYGGELIDATKSIEAVGRAVIDSIFRQIGRERLDQFLEFRKQNIARPAV